METHYIKYINIAFFSKESIYDMSFYKNKFDTKKLQTGNKEKEKGGILL